MRLIPLRVPTMIESIGEFVRSYWWQQNWASFALANGSPHTRPWGHPFLSRQTQLCMLSTVEPDWVLYDAYTRLCRGQDSAQDPHDLQLTWSLSQDLPHQRKRENLCWGERIEHNRVLSFPCGRRRWALSGSGQLKTGITSGSWSLFYRTEIISCIQRMLPFNHQLPGITCSKV